MYRFPQRNVGSSRVCYKIIKSFKHEPVSTIVSLSQYVVHQIKSKPISPLHQKWSFPLGISSVNVTKSADSSRFGHIYWRNAQWKTSFFVQCTLSTPFPISRHCYGTTKSFLWNVLNSWLASIITALISFHLIFFLVLFPLRGFWLILNILHPIQCSLER